MSFTTLPRSDCSSIPGQRIRAAGLAYQRRQEEKAEAAAAAATNAAKIETSRRFYSLPDRWRKVVAEVAEAHGVTKADVLGTSRQRRVVIPRHEVYYRLAMLSGTTLAGIGARLDRDHTSIRNGIIKHRAAHPGLPAPACMATMDDVGGGETP